jgi:hypothetical protein
MKAQWSEGRTGVQAKWVVGKPIPLTTAFGMSWTGVSALLSHTLAAYDGLQLGCNVNVKKLRLGALRAMPSFGLPSPGAWDRHI